MSCYHPLIGFPTGKLTVNGKPEYVIRKSSESANFQIELDNNENHILIPCGHCIGCRLDHSRAWADRMMLELETSKSGCFVTLTYDNEHIPPAQFDEEDNLLYGTLDKRDCQLFMKRLRKYFDGKKVRFYLAGEYGEHTLRPHYHAILFGLSLNDFPDKKEHGKNELGQLYYISDTLSRIWSKGFVLLSEVSWKTCAYVARYVTKKWSGPYAIDYAIRNCIPEFSLMSRKPGIGREYLELHPDCLDMANINLSTPDGGLKIQIPKYYYKQLIFEPSASENLLYNPEKYDKIMSERKRHAEDKMMIELSKTSLSYLEYLEACENKKLKQAESLKRGKV